MIIYIDESKRLGKWLIVVWWFVSSHNTSYIEKFIQNKRKDFYIPAKIELKSTDKYWRIFLDFLEDDEDFKGLDICTFGFCFDSYFFDSQEAYTNLLMKTLKEIYTISPYKGRKSVIVHDNINAKDNRFIIKKVEWFLKRWARY